MLGLGKKSGRVRRAELKREWQSYQGDRSAFVGQLGDGATSFLASRDDIPLLLSLGDRAVWISELASGNDFNVIKTAEVALADVLTVSIKHESRPENYRQRVVTPVPVSKRKSAIGRGLMGAMVAGPAGLVLGAASALTPEASLVEHVSYRSAVRIAAGKPQIVIETAEGSFSFEVMLVSTAQEICDAFKARGVSVTSGLP